MVGDVFTWFSIQGTTGIQGSHLTSSPSQSLPCGERAFEPSPCNEIISGERVLGRKKSPQKGPEVAKMFKELTGATVCGDR